METPAADSINGETDICDDGGENRPFEGHTYVALLRGINVGGKNTIPMAGLRVCLKNIGLVDVKTYIQSGNIVFRSEKSNVADLVADIGGAIRSDFGFSPKLQILTVDEMSRALATNPYRSRSVEDRSIHLFFLDAAPAAKAVQATRGLLAKSEECELVERVFYLYAPEGIARSKLAARAEQVLKVNATARNLRSGRKILELAQKTSRAVVRVE